MPKKAIASVHYPISKRDSSHRAGWARIWADILDADSLTKIMILYFYIMAWNLMDH